MLRFSSTPESRRGTGLTVRLAFDPQRKCRIEKGFDFLGCHFRPEALRVATATIQKFVERVTRLYEQKRTRQGDPDALGQYVRRWLRWLGGGLVRSDCREPTGQSAPRRIPPANVGPARLSG